MALQSQCVAAEKKLIDTPAGTIQVTTSTLPNTPQQITKIEGKELTHLISLSILGPKFVANYIPDSPNPDLEEYDIAFELWLNSSTKKFTVEQVVDILGGVLGNKLIKDFDMEWVSVTDEIGTDYAVRGKSRKMISFPFSSVLKRVDSKKSGFMNAVYYMIQDGIDSGEFELNQ